MEDDVWLRARRPPPRLRCPCPCCCGKEVEGLRLLGAALLLLLLLLPSVRGEATVTSTVLTIRTCSRSGGGRW